MLLRFGITVLLGHSEVDNVNNSLAGVLLVRVVAELSNQEVVGLDIAVNEVLLVDSLDAGKLHQVSTLDPGLEEHCGIESLHAAQNFGCLPSVWPPE